MAKKRVKLTEEDVLLAWEWLVEKEAREPRARVEYEDRLQTAWLGLLYAIRTWNSNMRPFEQYATDCIRAHLVYMQREERMETRAESGLSLDMTVAVDGETTYGEQVPYEETGYEVVLAELHGTLRETLRRLRELREEQGAYAFWAERLFSRSVQGESRVKGHSNHSSLMLYVDLHGDVKARAMAAKEQADEIWEDFQPSFLCLAENERRLLDAYYNRAQDWVDISCGLGISTTEARQRVSDALLRLDVLYKVR